ncbi:MAG: hypothetical protein WCR07_00045 [Verrucomicrobiota bacterium]|jgi:hypothetical protein
MGAWQPFTGGGIAAFARASTARTLVVQVLAACTVGAVVVWSVSTAWFPVIERGIHNLPTEAFIRRGTLTWPDARARRLAENPSLEWIVRPTALPIPDSLGQSSDLRVELRRGVLRVQGPLGHMEQPYPTAWDVPLGRIPAIAAWQSWKPYLSLLLGILVAMALLPCWWLLASAYCIPAWLLAHVVGKRPSLGDAWRVSSAALLMGAVVGAAGIAAYAHGIVRIPGLVASQAIHVPVPWIWLFWGILRLETGSQGSRSGRKTRS